MQLLAKLRTQESSDFHCAAAVALQHIDQLQQQHTEVLNQHQQHLLAAELFKEKSVVHAVQVRMAAATNIKANFESRMLWAIL